MSTRPRIEFNHDGICNACTWRDEKEKLNWQSRQDELEGILKWARESASHGGFDCIVPVSGGKDGSYVSYQLKHRYGMNPLCVTVKPPLELDVGQENLRNFVNSGYSHLHISLHPEALRQLNRLGFKNGGYPYLGWMIAIKTAVIQIALRFRIPLIFYGEDGEIEYGGSTETKDRPFYEIEYMKRVYFQGSYEPLITEVSSTHEFSDADLSFWRFPTDDEVKNAQLKFAHWSYFEPWDSYRNYLVAKEHCGLKEKEDSNSGTFTNFAQNDQALATLHYYLMYLKFGFGRATQDAGIEIRRGAMNRDQALNLVKLYDNQYPAQFLEQYLDYYQISRSEFDSILDECVNKKLFSKVDGYWEPNFTVGEAFSR
jgi:N-acetyl sugar amidotransferase